MLTREEAQLALGVLRGYNFWTLGTFYWNTAHYVLSGTKLKCLLTRSRSAKTCIQKLQNHPELHQAKGITPHAAIAIFRGVWKEDAWEAALEDLMGAFWGDLYRNGDLDTCLTLTNGYFQLLPLGNIKNPLILFLEHYLENGSFGTMEADPDDLER